MIKNASYILKHLWIISSNEISPYFSYTVLGSKIWDKNGPKKPSDGETEVQEGGHTGSENWKWGGVGEVESDLPAEAGLIPCYHRINKGVEDLT